MCVTLHRGALVQLVRMPACHAGGRWFESCTHRKWREEKSEDVLRHYSLFLSFIELGF